MQVIFDYEALDSSDRIFVQQKAQAIKERLQQVAKNIWQIGQQLTQVRSRLQHGHFIAWLKAEFGWSSRTAYNFINVYKAFPKFENFAKIDVAASALYLLAAPSTPQSIRDEFLKRAQSGEKISHKNVHKSIKATKLESSFSSSQNQPLPVSTQKLEIIDIIPKAEVAKAQKQELTFDITSATSTISIPEGWSCLQGKHYVFYGNTASPQFFSYIPSAAIALAITSDDWDHDWLIEQARNILILDTDVLNEESLEQLLLMFSNPGEVVVSPWLPHKEIIAVTHRLERQLYAGDSNLNHLIKAIARSNLGIQSISP